MKLITWNIISAPAPTVALTKSENPDVVCLQEIKVHIDCSGADIEALGYKHAFPGMKGYNGVAILSAAICATDGRDFCGRMTAGTSR